MGLKSLKQTALLNFKNIPGKHFKNKILVIECDDWGGIRMPSKEVYESLIINKIPFPDDHFDKLDTLEDKTDLESLFELLFEVKDATGRHAVITPVVNVANPDFDKIQASGFQNYFFETYPQTLARYHRDPTVLSLWKQGIELKIFVPEYHGREHLCVQLWLRALREGNKHLLNAFKLGYTTVFVDKIHPVANGFRPQFFFDDNDQKYFLSLSIKEGTDLFNKIFGYHPISFVPSNGVFHPDFNIDVISAGIKYLNVSHLVPVPNGEGSITIKRFYYTRKGENSLTYYLRNCAFEPSGCNYSGIETTLKQVEAAFRWGKPAIISSHRVNFIGGISHENRIHGLKELTSLLNAILKKWPDVMFMSTRDLINMVEN
jgi:hypothetical protein